MITLSTLKWQQAVLDRGSERRTDPGFLNSLSGLESTRYLILSEGKTLLSDSGIYYLDAGQAGLLNQLTSADNLQIYLGRVEEELAEDLLGPSDELRPGTDVVAVVLGKEAFDDSLLNSLEVVPAARWKGFREVSDQLTVLDAQNFIQALAISNWHRVHTHCPRCGALTLVESSGWTRHCPQDGSDHFPRTDPAIIVTVIGPDDRVLLGNGAVWDADRFSTLAGFVEPGESLEQAVAREVFEEVGVHVTEVEYLGTQSWPFPASLMVGFTARTEDRELNPDGKEVVAARWFSRAELQNAVSAGEVKISPRLSIARALIEQWYGGEINDQIHAASSSRE